MKKEENIDLTLIKQLLSEVEVLISKAEYLKSSSEDDSYINEYIVTLAKSSGLILGISQESAMLLTDIQQAVQNCYQAPATTNDFLGSLLKIKPSGTSN